MKLIYADAKWVGCARIGGKVNRVAALNATIAILLLLLSPTSTALAVSSTWTYETRTSTDALSALPTPPPGFTINTTTDSGDSIINGVCETAPGNGQCTLRAAIQEAKAHPGATIDFKIPTTDPGYSNGTWTIKLFTALPDLTAPMTISGPGADKLVVRKGVVFDFRIFNVPATGTVALSGITITGGANTTTGAAINHFSTGILNVKDCVLADNHAGDGGGIYNRDTGTVNVSDSTISNNSGSGIFVFGGTANITNCEINGNTGSSGLSGRSEGGGILNDGTVTVRNSTISGNKANLGGGIYSINGTALTLINSTVSNNLANYQDNDEGGGIFNNIYSTINVINSTITGNLANFGGGIWNDSTGTINLSNSTVTNNSVTSIGGGIVNNSTGPFNVKSTIVALNTAAGSAPDVSGTFTSAGFNLVGIDQNNGFSTSTDLKGGAGAALDPKLGPLQDNGGPTETRALLTGSPAIDKGTSNVLTGKVTVDQRGVGYARTINKSIPNATGGDGTDIGAFELGAQIKAGSRKIHGTAGTFDINLPLFGPVLGVECRKGSTYKVILTFPTAVTVASATVTPDPNAPGAKGSVNSFAVNGRVVTVNLTGVSNAQTIVLTLFGVSDGTNQNEVSVPMAVLLGDTNKSRTVSSADVTLTQSKVGQVLSATNFREDVTVDGSINSTDVNLVQSKVGTKLP